MKTPQDRRSLADGANGIPKSPAVSGLSIQMMFRSVSCSDQDELIKETQGYWIWITLFTHGHSNQEFAVDLHLHVISSAAIVHCACPTGSSLVEAEVAFDSASVVVLLGIASFVNLR